jgi:hypothetical protein
LAQSQRAQALHLCKTLQRRITRPGDHIGVARGGEIALREAGIVVSGTDETVEVDLFGDVVTHCGKPGAAIGAAFSASCVATGKAT